VRTSIYGFDRIIKLKLAASPDGSASAHHTLIKKMLNNSLGTKEAKVKPESKEFGNYFLPLRNN